MNLTDFILFFDESIEMTVSIVVFYFDDFNDIVNKSCFSFSFVNDVNRFLERQKYE